MPTSYSKKSHIILAICLCMYVLLSSLLLYYIEECANNPKEPQNAPLLRKVRQICHSAMQKMGNNNKSIERCAGLMKEGVERYFPHRKRECRFGPKSYMPWLHSVMFSLMTIGVPHIPISTTGKYLLLMIIIIGIFPTIRLFMHSGLTVSGLVEHCILSFELKFLNRSPRMIHSMSAKIISLQALVIILYNLGIAKVTSLDVYGTNWTYSDSLLFWFSGAVTTGHGIEVINNTEFYSNGGWRIICIDLAMVVSLVLVSGFACSVVQQIHKAACPAAASIRNAVEKQAPEVYLHIKPLKTHL